MRDNIPTHGTISWGRRLMPAAIALGLALMLVLGFAQTAGAQSNSAASANGPLTFGNNFFVTGDYVVAGAYGMNSHLTGGFATGTINVPDKNPISGLPNPGIRGTTSVPKGAQIVAALLYWQTVEKATQPGTGQNGFFRPVFTGGPQTGYPISGVNLPSHSAVSFSNGGCSSGSTGKIVQTYRADVRSFLPRDANGNVLVDSTDGVTFEVRLPSTGNTTPITLGASLVLIYRVISPNLPLNSITVYDGAFAPTATTTLTMSQPVQGFYQAARSPVSRLTHIVGSGQSNKFQTAYLSGGLNGIQRATVALPSPYGNGQAAFPGWYGNWDNTTWIFPDSMFPNLANPLHEYDDSATTMVVPSGSQMGCVSWGAVIVATTVHDDNKDGLLQVWKQNQGYTDVGTGQFVSLADTNDPPGPNQQDVFIQLDHVVVDPTPTGNYAPQAGVESTVKSAFLAHNIHLHITDKYAIQEPACTDNLKASPPQLCPYPNQPGITTWPDGFEFVKNQLVDPNGNVGPCTTSPPPANCAARFPIAERNSHHYVVFGDALGGANWALLGGTLTDSTGTGAGVVIQQGNTVTFYTSRGHGLTVNNVSGNGRVTITGAITNPSLNGTYLVSSVQCQPNPAGMPDCSVTNKAAGPYIFTVRVGGNPTVFNYTRFTDPNLTVASGQAGTGSGFSDIGGADTLVTLGLWGPKNTARAQEGTFMHELGHTLGLTHGGYYYGNLAANLSDYTPTIGENCKSNYQSVMNYMFQTALLGTNGGLDFSSQELNILNEDNLGSITTMGMPIAFSSASWYDTKKPPVVIVNGVPTLAAATATHHCDGTPLSSTDPATYFYQGGTTPFSGAGELDIPWSTTMLDANFDGKVETTNFRGYNDWANTDPRQVGATGSVLLGPGGLFTGPGGFFTGPGGLFTGPGGLFTGPGGFFTGPGGLFTGPGGLFTGPGGLFTGPGVSGGEIDLATVLSVTHPPSTLVATEAASPRVIHLTWTAPTFFDKFNIYRSAHKGVTFSLIGSTTNTFFDDTVTCNPTGYQYFVTTVLQIPQDQESTPSNIVSTGIDGLLTGCYVVSNFSSPANAVQGSSLQVTWTLTDDFNAVGNPVTRQAANTLVAIGPLLNSCTTGRTTLLADGVSTSGVDTFTSVANQFTFTWNNTDAFCAGSYSFELDLDHVKGSPAQVQPDATQLQLGIDVTDTDSTPQITSTAIPNGVVGTFYSNTIPEHGGVTGQNPFTWTLANGSNPLPPGLSLGTAPDGVSGLLSGIPSAADMFSFTVQVTDSVGNIGTQTLTMTVTTPVAQINQALVPDSSVPGAAAFLLMLKGTGFGPHSQVLWNGTPRTTTFISSTQLTAAISAGDVQALGTASVSVSNPVTLSNQPVPSSNVDFFQITPTTSASLSRTDYPTGTNSNGLIAADFDGDGKLDLAIANSGDNTVTIMLGNGDGTFSVQPNLGTGNASGSGPNSLIAGDFNNDGKLDLAFANFASGTPSDVSVFLGNGDGTFQAGVTYAVGNGPFSLVTGDFNRDGKLDLAVANQNDHNVSILLGNGDGTFQAQKDYAAGPTGVKDASDIALGDFNGDGKLDLAVTNPSTDQVSILLGQGDGTFQAPTGYSTGASGSHPIAVSAADFNGDGKLDLAVTTLNTRNIAILIGNGDGTFQNQVSYPTTTGVSIGPVAVATGDFNGDGKLDVAITNQGDNSVSILLGNGDGTFQPVLEFATGTTATGVAAGDFNRDGRLDVAVANQTSNTVSVMRQRPEPTTTLAVSSVTASQVSLTWTASVSTTVVGYNVYRGTTSGGPYTKVNSAIVAAPAFTDISVASDTTYYYVVTAVDPGNLESVNSNEVSATTPPQPPTTLMVSNVTASQVTLTWTASTTATVVSYNVYRSLVSGSGYVKIGSVNAVAANFTDLSVASGTTYYYVVTAVGPGNAESVFSNEVSATTP
ncbi:MAG: hypothetical protein DMG39_21320 [Acidobacteria bacterium]|nr:MAG: hypothetical protein DMG39_21320 [Acidobacteriota bacterium]